MPVRDWHVAVMDVQRARKINSSIGEWGASSTQYVGNGGAGGARIGFPLKHLHVIHLWMSDLTKLPVLATNLCKCLLHHIVLHLLMCLLHLVVFS